MPERLESELAGKPALHLVENEDPADLVLENVQVDATEKEQTALSDDCPGKHGHVYDLPSSSTIVRGQISHQTVVYPPKYATTATDPPVPVLSHGLVLSGVYPHPRNVIFKFVDGGGAAYWLQVQLLKHTVLQVYDKSDWNASVRKVHKKPRGFKVGIAFEFKKHVVAFLTQDLLLQMHWANTRGELPAQQPDVYYDFPCFLDALTVWMRQRREDKVNRSGNAMEKLRTEGIMCGVGVYTVSELWHRAGLSPSLTEAEVFDSASRTARLCAAYYSFVHDAIADDSLWTLVKRHMVNYTIAVHTEDRMKYADTLYVWAKDRCSFTTRFHNLLKKFKSSVQSAANNHASSLVRRADDPAIPSDVFEPELCRAALLLPDDRNLGPLIFGESEWLRLAAGLPPSCLAPDNALTRYFAKPEFNTTSKTWLDPGAYDFLLSEAPSRSQLCANWTRTILYRVNNANVWSVIPIYENSIPDTPQYPEYIPVIATTTKKKSVPTKPLQVKFILESQEERKKLLISYVTQHTKNYTIGPLDYCGIARRVKTSGKDIIMLCEEDPRVLSFFQERRAYERETAKLKGAGTEKDGLAKNIVTKLKKEA
ncbi:hypothetical protein FPV67DRAFT_440258 [Lyophyllum atratum]|nr:hypothetical protein FPV67DRAFT_440258 [Lyophyllum atratum]